MTPPKRKVSVLFKVISVVQTIFLTVFLVLPPNLVQAQTFNVLNLPEPGSLINVSESFVPVLLKGISLHPENPLVFDFIVDPGNTGFGDNQIREEGQRLIKYFLAALTVPEKDLWVNLSPYEQDRIIPTAFGQTEMGRDLLAQDYILKQISASMIYPERDLGKDFWGRVYAKAKEVYGTVKIPVSTFNKVWIVPDKAVIVENDQTAFVAQGHLKVMLEEDYAALNENRAAEILGNNRLKDQDLKKLNSISSSVVREIILPEIEKEVNEGKNFAQLRQIYYSLVLAAWFKNNLKDNILTQVYADQQKISGVNINDINDKEKIYDRYMEAYRQGVFNYIREDVDATTQEMIPRKYFSGGADYTKVRETIINRPVTGPGDIKILEDRGVIPQNALNTAKPDESFRVLTTGLNRFNGASASRNDIRIKDAAMLSSNGERTVLSLDQILNRSQMSDAAKIETVQAAAPILREALKSENPQVKAAAERVITGLSPITQSAAGFTREEVASARQGSIEQVINPETRLQAAFALQSGGIVNEQAREVIAQPLSFESLRSSSTPSIVPMEAVYRQMPEAQQIETLKLAMPVLKSDNLEERLAAERIVTSTPRATALNAGLNEAQIADAVRSTEAQLERPETAIPAAYALKAGGIETSRVTQVTAQPLSAMRESADAARPTMPEMKRQINTVEILLSTPQMLPQVERGQVIQTVAPALKLALSDGNNDLQMKEAAQRAVVVMTPAERIAVGLSQEDVSRAEQGTLEQLTSAQPETRIAAARSVVMGDIQTPVGERNVPAVTLARTVMAEPIAVQPASTQRASARNVEIAFAQMPETLKVNAISEFAVPALRNGDAQEQEVAARMVASSPRLAAQAGLNEREIADAVRSTEAQLERPETAIPAAYALKAGGIETARVTQVTAQPLAAMREPADVTRPTMPEMKRQINTVEILLSTPQMLPQVERGQAIQTVAPALKLALSDSNSDSQMKEAAQRTVVVMTPAERSAVGLSQEEVSRAEQGTLEQLTSAQPETRIAAARSVVMADIQTPVGEQNVPASTFAARTIAQQPAMQARVAIEQNQGISVGQMQTIEVALRASDFSRPEAIESVKSVSSQLRDLLMSPTTAPEVRESVERTIASLPASIQNDAGFTSMEINIAQEGVVRQLTDNSRPDVQLAASQAALIGDIQQPAGPRAVPAVVLARTQVTAPFVVRDSAASEQIIRDIETVFTQISPTAQVEALGSLAVPALRSNVDTRDRLVAQRLVASSPKLALQAGLSEREIADAVRSTEAQLERPETAIPAAYALKAGGIETARVTQVTAQPLSAMREPADTTRPTMPEMQQQINTVEILLSVPQMPQAERGQVIQTAAPALKLALSEGNNDLQMKEAAQRTVVVMTPAERSAVGLNQEEVKRAELGTLEQLTSAQPETRIAAARSVVMGDIQTPVGERNVPAVTLARTVMAEPIAVQQASTQRASARNVEIAFAQMPETLKVNAISEFAAPALRNGDAQEQEVAARMVSSSPRLAAQAGLNEREIADAVRSTEAQLERPETAIPAAYALKAGGVETARVNEVVARPLAESQATISTAAIVNAESVFPQMPEANQVQTLTTLTPLLNTGTPQQQATVARIIASAPEQVSARAGLSQPQIANAVTATQAQLDRPETALQAAVALKSAGRQDVRVDNILQQELVQVKDLGGIDFNPALIKMEINKENGGIKVQFDPRILQEIRAKGVDGFIPVILNVQPLKTALPLMTKSTVQEQTIQLTKL